MNYYILNSHFWITIFLFLISELLYSSFFFLSRTLSNFAQVPWSFCSILIYLFLCLFSLIVYLYSQFIYLILFYALVVSNILYVSCGSILFLFGLFSSSQFCFGILGYLEDVYDLVVSPHFFNSYFRAENQIWTSLRHSSLPTEEKVTKVTNSVFAKTLRKCIFSGLT